MPADRDFVASTTSRLKDVGRRSGVTDFVRWWGAELGPLVPSATRNAVQRRRMRPVIAFADDAATIWQPYTRGGEIGMDRVARVPLDDEAAAAVAGPGAIEALGRATGSTSVVVALAPQHVLRRTLALPEAIEENLHQAIAYDLDRHTPFRPDDLYFDAVVAGRDAARGQLRIDLAAARRAIVDKALATVEGWGATVVAVVPDAPETAATSRLNLLPEERRQARGGPRWGFWIPLAVVGLAAAVALALPVWQKREEAIALLRQADEARGQAAVSENLRRELDGLVATYNFALERKFAYPPAVQVADEVTKLLPDDTWLTQLEVKSAARGKEQQRELLVRGESNNAGRLITLFEESKVFTQAAPRSPTTKIQPGPGEIFDLVAQVRPLARPEPLSLADAPPLPKPAAVTPAAPAPAASGAAPVVPPASAAVAPPAAAPVSPLASPGAPQSALASPGAPQSGAPAPRPKAQP